MIFSINFAPLVVSLCTMHTSSHTKVSKIDHHGWQPTFIEMERRDAIYYTKMIEIFSSLSTIKRSCSPGRELGMKFFSCLSPVSFLSSIPYFFLHNTWSYTCFASLAKQKMHQNFPWISLPAHFPRTVSHPAVIFPLILFLGDRAALVIASRTRNVFESPHPHIHIHTFTHKPFIPPPRPDIPCLSSSRFRRRSGIKCVPPNLFLL